ncbi:SulP family sulfate permease [Paenibacillus cellulosilyticus]|uniref:SulP family sulfate permease n=1 Tax=Paenibacillus cellulosilyticus TaxID=375489 RepID=A0A2V2YSL6_9BACL|nr:sulfate permease [Paenibacillus cellulosilyticus]PWW00912.1 SulP family sulfate permease [Paenibacillus cellulosilyticus]QKS47567.1 sulfate permease [Paenibacillus cellulosilyticus]
MKWTSRFEGYHAAAFRRDIISGLIVGIIAIPLGMAFAIASGVKPEYGIYTTIIAGILISLLGGSRFQIGGPTGAFIPILFAIVLQYGYDNLLLAGLMAGVMLVLMGLFRLGALIKFIPRPVTIGFTAGIAVIIFSGQVQNLLGLSGMKKHEYFIPNMTEIAVHLSTVNIYSVVTAAICFAAALLTPKVLPRIPGSLTGLIASSVVSALFFDGHVATIGSSFGAIPSELPQFRLPDITWDRVRMLLQPAFIIAMLGGIESLLSAVVADGMTGTRHNSNRELIGQGIANIVTPLFGGIPATGAIARTATNIKNGAASPISGIVHGIVVFLILMLFAPFAANIPLASMAPILMLVAWNMSERKEFVHILKTRTSDSIVLLITFTLTVLTSLPTAVEVGLVLSVLLFVKRMSELLKVTKVLPDSADKRAKVKAYMVSEAHDCPQISIFNLEGPLFFGTANIFEKSMSTVLRPGLHFVILRMTKVPYVDMTGESKLARFINDIKKTGGTVLISGIQPQSLEVFKRTALHSVIGEQHFFEHTGDAIDYAIARLDGHTCKGCKHFAFRECTALSNVPNELGGL